MTSLLTSRRGRLLGVILVALGLVSAGPQSAHAQRPRRGGRPRSEPGLLAAFRKVVAGPSRSTVRVRCDGKDVALGTIVGADGWVLTKASELSGPITCRLHDGRELEARVVGVHEAYDLAMLRIDARDLEPVAWADSKTAPVGNWVASAGPGALPVAVGMVSVAARKITGRELAQRPSPKHGFLGIQVEVDEEGVKVGEVVPGSAAARGGLEAGDQILRVAGKPIDGREGLFAVMQKTRGGQVVAVHIRRGSRELERKVTLGHRPLGRSDYQNQLGSPLSERRTGFPTILQHDTVLRPTDCGGPLVDLDGKTIGINIARAGRTESYAIPAEAVRPLLADLKSGKLAPASGPRDTRRSK